MCTHYIFFSSKYGNDLCAAISACLSFFLFCSDLFTLGKTEQRMSWANTECWMIDRLWLRWRVGGLRFCQLAEERDRKRGESPRRRRTSSPPALLSWTGHGMGRKKARAAREPREIPWSCGLVLGLSPMVLVQTH